MEQDLSEECPKLVEGIAALLNAHPQLQENEEAFLYALSQVLHDKIRDSSLCEEEKGATVSNINTAFKASFKIDIALYHERLRYLVEQKNSTTH